MIWMEKIGDHLIEQSPFFFLVICYLVLNKIYDDGNNDISNPKAHIQ